MQLVQSVQRSFRLLYALQSGPASLTELARQVDLPISTTSRLLGTLEEVEAIERLYDLGLYRLGNGIAVLASGVDSSRTLRVIAADELRALAVQSNEATALSITSGYRVHYIAEERPETAVQLRDWMDARLPLHLVAAGFVVMASWPDDAVDVYLSSRLESPTDRSVVDPELLRRRVRAASLEGFAWTTDELEIGVTSVAAPVVTRTGETVGALTIHGPSYRFPGGRKRDFEKLVRVGAERIAALIA